MMPSVCSFIVDSIINNNTTYLTHPTAENVHSVTTCKKGQQKQQNRFLQEYKSETAYTPEEGQNL
jgi:hypothetical protein